MKIIHQRKKCIGCGNCAIICPKIFKMDEGRKACFSSSKVKYDPKTDEGILVVKKIGCGQEAADACPVQCIIVS